MLPQGLVYFLNSYLFAMLTQADLSLNIRCLHLLSKLGIFPFQIDPKTGKISIQDGSGLRFWWCIIFASQFQTLWIAWRVYLKYENSPGRAIRTLPLDYMTLVPGQMCVWMAIMNFKRWPQFTEQIFNGFLSATEGQQVLLLYCKPRKRKRLWTKLTWLEMATATMPVLVYPTAVCVIVAFEVLSTWPATRGWHVLLRIGLTAMDTGTLVSRTSWIYFSVLIQLLFFGELSYFLKRETVRLR